MGNWSNKNSWEIFFFPSQHWICSRYKSHFLYTAQSKLSREPMNRINLSKLTSGDMGEISWLTRSERGGGVPFLDLFFPFSISKRLYKLGGGVSSNLGIKNLLLMRDIYTKNGTLGLKQNQSDQIVSYHISGIKDPHLIYNFTYVGSVQLELDYWCKSRPRWANSRQTYALRMLPPMDGGVGHDIGNMSLMQIDYSTRIGSLNKTAQ